MAYSTYLLDLFTRVPTRYKDVSELEDENKKEQNEFSE